MRRKNSEAAYIVDRIRLVEDSDILSVRIFIVPIDEKVLQADRERRNYEDKAEAEYLAEKYAEATVIKSSPFAPTDRRILSPRSKAWGVLNCPHCDKKFTIFEKASLRYEAVNHEYQGKIIIYECDSCHETFFHHQATTEPTIQWPEVLKISKPPRTGD